MIMNIEDFPQTPNLDELKLLKTIINQHPDPIVVKNWQGEFVLCNDTVAALYNTTPDAMVGKTDFDFTGNKEQSDFFKKNVQSIMEKGKKEVVYEDSTDANSGEVRHFQSIKIPFLNELNEKHILVVARDITEITRLKNQAEEDANRLRYVLETTQDGIWDWNIQTNEVLHNKKWLETTGIKNTKSTFAEFESLIHPEDKDEVKYALERALKEQKDYRIQFRITKQDTQQLIWVYDRGSVVESDSSGQPTRMVGAIVDITEQVKAQQQINEMAFYDPLTSLPNRRLLTDHIQLALSHCNRNQKHAALLFIDLDHFKILNDTHGHQIGDLLLQDVANRLKNHIRGEDTVARFGGDEFVVLINSLSRDAITASKQATVRADQIRQIIAQTYQLKINHEQEIKHFITASVGINIFTGKASAEELLKLSDLALYKAKVERDTSILFDPLMQQELDHNNQLQKDFRKSLDNQDFELFYQPQFNSEEEIIGMESLIRWKHPDKGYITPNHFIPMAEDTLMIISLGNWVLKTACEQIAKWQSNPALRSIPISVNISAKQVWHPDFVVTVLSLVEGYKLPPGVLKIEITETILLRDIDETINKFNQLRDKGIKISLDDFGTGYSSLSYLKRLPIDEIKIDQSFIRDLEQDASDAIMVKAISELGSNFEIDVIAEGVETAKQLEILQQYHCFRYQGFFFSQPKPVNMYDELD